MYTKTLVVLLFCCVLQLSGCSDPPATSAPSSRPVKIFTVEGLGNQAVRNFPGRVQASRRANLSFRLPGVVEEILVREGEFVQQGQVLARLDDTDYRIAMEDRQATFDSAQNNYQRAKELINDGAISRMDYDRLEAEFRTAQAALNQAKADLDHTELRAPFDGNIGNREVENFEEVQAKQTIFQFQNLSQLDIQIDVPESLVRRVRPDARERMEAARAAGEEPKVVAIFDGHPDEAFPLLLKELATRADPQTQTFKTTLTMPKPETFQVLPGMTVNVRVDLSALLPSDSTKWVPVRAVQADSGLNPRVWKLDPDSMTVQSLAVKTGRMSGGLVEITEGLQGGEEIVSVGASYLSEGMQVTRMHQSEQAIPREDEPL
ncbi:efflux RND transporter periplasmic adaptor subunit [Alteromonas aestuariivivens]|uniref:Efflux RND transporter periplasmic adaptor subunit n=1 Tax=Alteromonas aestuariivivens TaxID=1938339 RepID=A0A3D8MEH3_9ALTE|nr:efflux RND transporter periplasmic adaptor subunit [Alteromonas aestuariivivens]RDV28914.1 efflux RND transporter periplasmic adaptor subunit [Alteromonas aestuariivivens]